MYNYTLRIFNTSFPSTTKTVTITYLNVNLHVQCVTSCSLNLDFNHISITSYSVTSRNLHAVKTQIQTTDCVNNYFNEGGFFKSFQGPLNDGVMYRGFVVLNFNKNSSILF
jgi:hypothetical protein